MIVSGFLLFVANVIHLLFIVIDFVVMLTLIWPCVLFFMILVKVILYFQVRWDQYGLGRLWCIYVYRFLSYLLYILFANEMFTIYSVNNKRSTWHHGGTQESALLIQLFHAQRNAYMLIDLMFCNYLVYNLDSKIVHAF